MSAAVVGPNPLPPAPAPARPASTAAAVDTRVAAVANPALAEGAKAQAEDSPSCCARVFYWLISPFTWLINAISSCFREIFSDNEPIVKPKPLAGPPAPPPASAPAASAPAAPAAAPAPAPTGAAPAATAPAAGSTAAGPARPAAPARPAPTPAPTAAPAAPPAAPAPSGGSRAASPASSASSDGEEEVKKRDESRPESIAGARGAPAASSGNPPKVLPLNKQLAQLKTAATNLGRDIRGLPRSPEDKDLGEFIRIHKGINSLWDDLKRKNAILNAQKSQNTGDVKEAKAAAEAIKKTSDEFIKVIAAKKDFLNGACQELEALLSSRIGSADPSSEDMKNYYLYMGVRGLLKQHKILTHDDPATLAAIEKARGSFTDGVGFINVRGLPPGSPDRMQSVCWMNSSVQALLACKKVRDAIMEPIIQGANESKRDFEKRQRLQPVLQGIVRARETGDLDVIKEAQEKLEEELFNRQHQEFNDHTRNKYNDGAALIGHILDLLLPKVDVKTVREEADEKSDASVSVDPRHTLEISFKGDKKDFTDVELLIGANMTYKDGSKDVRERLLSVPPLLSIQLKRSLGTVDLLAQRKLPLQQAAAKQAEAKVSSQQSAKPAAKGKTDDKAEERKLKKAISDARQKAFDEVEQKVTSEMSSKLNDLMNDKGMIEAARRMVCCDDAVAFQQVFEDALKPFVRELLRIKDVDCKREVQFPEDGELVLTDIFDERVKPADEEISYRIRSFVTFNPGNRHYVAYRCIDDGKTWQECDDSKVRVITKDELVEAFKRANSILLEHLA